jgi:hypothetical protein
MSRTPIDPESESVAAGCRPGNLPAGTLAVDRLTVPKTEPNWSLYGRK